MYFFKNISWRTLAICFITVILLQMTAAQEKCKSSTRCRRGTECIVVRYGCRGTRCITREVCIPMRALASNNNVRQATTTTTTTTTTSPPTTTTSAPTTTTSAPTTTAGASPPTAGPFGLPPIGDISVELPKNAIRKSFSRFSIARDCSSMKCADGQYCKMSRNSCTSLPCRPVPECADIVEKEGECPTVSVSRISGDCRNTCSMDSHCLGTKKCCMIGCKKTCMEPKMRDQTKISAFCPVFPEVELSDCSSQCSDDSQCSQGLACCKYGCSMRCVRQLNASDPGERPNTCPLNFDPPTSRCDVNCTVDSDCDGIDKCCLTGCSMVCQPGLAIHPASRHRPGYCPDTIPGGTCSSNCSVDSRCPGEQKCCSFDCGRVCVDALSPPAGVTKAGVCPAATRGIALARSCRESCRFDDACPNEQKCCQYGCVSECMTPLQVGGQTVGRQQPGGSNEPEPQLAPGERDGTCPSVTLMSNQRRCSNRCNVDDDCPQRMKCCMFGCGKRCINAIPPTKQRAQPVCGRGGCTENSCPRGQECVSDGCNKVCRTAATPTNKAGTCPNFPSSFRILRCTSNCENDASCKGSSKCCAYGSCKRCFRPVVARPRTVSRASQCPEMSALSNLTSCEPMCSSDSSCSGGEKCCPYGCSTKCLSPNVDVPILKAGYCRATRFNIPSIACFKSCNSDKDCSGNTKCCANGCNMACSTARKNHPKASRPGSCPAVTMNSPTTNCYSACSSDFACPQEQKCCYNGCRRECVPAVKNSAPAKVGFCPADSVARVNSYQDFRRMDCGHYCNSDFACPGDLKCCKQGCKTSCMAVQESPAPVIKAGYCPAPLDDPLTCERSCNSDLSCDGDQKCCFHGGCTQRCTGPETTKPAPRPGMCPIVSPLPVDQCKSSVEFCNSDHACPDPLKCCFDGCVNRCLNPESSLVSSREGFCPGFSSDEGSSCVVECTSDDACPEPQKCCSVGCAVKCIAPLATPPKDKAGFCPFIPLPLSQTCDQSCALDDSCPGTMKCCQNGCSRKCYSPVPLPPAILKAGFCPASIENPTCDTPCTSDGTCPGEQKCCKLSCGMSCVDAVEQAPNVKPGFCPFVHKNVSTMCLHTCSSDFSCPGETKCCSFGDCSMRCMSAERFPHVTTKPGDCPATSGVTGRPERILCLSDYSCPGNEKCCRVGNAVQCEAPPTRFADQGRTKTGVCPNIRSTSPVCRNRCFSDTQCSGDRKCCKAGCSSVCVAPALDAALTTNDGFCPYVDLHVMAPCNTNCTSDGDCSENEKCCEYGCGMRCLRSQPFPPFTVKDGTCPSPRAQNRLYDVPGGSFWFLTKETPSRETYGYRNCRNDGQCPGSMKCCLSSIGGRECVAAI